MLRFNKRLNISGFTMQEMLLGLVIAGAVIAATMITYIAVSQMWKDDLVMNELSRNANIGIERMLHGIPKNTGLLAARSISAPSTGATADSVTYVDQASGATRRFYYLAGKVYAALGTATGNAIISDINSVTFFNNGQTVLISLALRKLSGRKEINLSAKTQVRIRN